MKNTTWAVHLAALLFVCIGASIFLMGGNTANRAQITSDGAVIKTLDLSIDQEFTVTGEHGTNTVTVKDGKIAVTAADCPDHYCIDRGFCNSGTQIVCLPNRLVITVLDEEIIDGVVG